MTSPKVIMMEQVFVKNVELGKKIYQMLFSDMYMDEVADSLGISIDEARFLYDKYLEKRKADEKEEKRKREIKIKRIFTLINNLINETDEICQIQELYGDLKECFDKLSHKKLSIERERYEKQLEKWISDEMELIEIRTKNGLKILNKELPCLQNERRVFYNHDLQNLVNYDQLANIS